MYKFNFDDLHQDTVVDFFERLMIGTKFRGAYHYRPSTKVKKLTFKQDSEYWTVPFRNAPDHLRSFILCWHGGYLTSPKGDRFTDLRLQKFIFNRLTRCQDD